MEVQSQPARRWRSRIIQVMLPVLLLATGGLVFQTLKASRPQAEVQPQQERAWTVRTLAAQLGTEHPELTLYGRVESPRLTRITAAVTAFVKDVHVDEGQHIESGELLIQLDDRDARLVVQQREADLAAIGARIRAEHVRHQADRKALSIEQELLSLSRRAVKRFENLASRKVGSEEQLDDARRNWQQQALALNSRRQALNDHPNRLAQLEAEQLRSHALLDSARLELSRTRIEAPFNGRVSRLQAVPGDRVRSGDPLISLYNPSVLEIRAQIPDRHLTSIRQALSGPAPLIASAQPGAQPLQLTLDRLAGEVDGGRAGIDALFKIDNTVPLEPGRALALQLQLPALSDVVALPPQALYGLNRIYRVVDERLDSLTVERVGTRKGRDGSTRILVRSPDLHSGDSIVITQLPNAIPGLKVKEA